MTSDFHLSLCNSIAHSALRIANYELNIAKPPDNIPRGISVFNHQKETNHAITDFTHCKVHQ